MTIKFFKTYEYYLQTEQSQTFRDGLHRMEKYLLITSCDIWLDMRNVRNRIIHDYMPKKVAEMYRLIREPFFSELSLLNEKIQTIN